MKHCYKPFDEANVRAKSLLLVLFFSISSFAVTPRISKTLTARVDPRMELLSVVFRLAGNPEYGQCPIKSYANDVDSYFAPYKNHPAIEMARRLRESNGVAHDAVASMAVYLSPSLEPVVPFSDQVPESRWGKLNAVEFASKLRDFSRDTRFEKFFAAHQALYATAEVRFQAVLDRFDSQWYPQFYGVRPKGSFHVILGLLLGPGNYGPQVVFPDGREEKFAIIGCAADENAQPYFPPQAASGILGLVVHEFNHSFVNAVVHRHWNSFGGSEKVYEQVSGQMRQLAYGSTEVMVNESLVRAAVILYMESHGETQEELRARIIQEQAQGFVWMEELYTLLRGYEADRKRYRDFESFIGLASGFFNAVGIRVPALQAEFENNEVRITGIKPFTNHDVEVDPKITEMILVLDKEINPKNVYMYIPYGKETGNVPLSGRPEILPGNREVKLPLKLEPNTTYTFPLHSWVFHSREGYPLQDYQVKFKTK